MPKAASAASASSNKSLKYILKNKNKYELICSINNDNLNYPKIDENEPIFFSHLSEKLIKLLRMSDSIAEFNKNLKMCALYVQLIRCFFIINLKNISGSPKTPKTPKTKALGSRAKSLSIPRRSKSKSAVFKYNSV